MTKLLTFSAIPHLSFSRHSVAAWLLLSAACSFAPLSASAASVGQLRCEYLKDPLGIDALQPRLSWVLDAGKSAAREQAQSGYQILVARNLNELEANQGDLWDSGHVNSDQSIQVRYVGKALASEQECFWKVRVWDDEGKPSAWSEPARWTMGLLNPSDWHGKWIGLDESAAADPAKKVLGNAQWIWFPEGQPDKAAPVGTRYFRKAITLPADRTVKQATLFFTADNSGEFYVNGQKAGAASDFHAAARFDVTGQLVRGKNLLAVSVRNEGSDPNPAGLIALLRVEFAQGDPLIVETDSSWTSGN
jgi:alpha-L-rhamnosidase